MTLSAGKARPQVADLSLEDKTGTRLKVVRYSARRSGKLYTDTWHTEKKGSTKNYSPLCIENRCFALSKEASAHSTPRSYKACDFQAWSLGLCQPEGEALDT